MSNKQPAKRKKPDLDEKAIQGLMCPKCECRHFYTVWTRRVGKTIRRGRECRYCGRRTITVEKVEV